MASIDNNIATTLIDSSLTTIVEISKLVTSSKDFFAIKDIIIDKIIEVIPSDRVCVNLFKKNMYDYTYLVCKKTLGNIPNYFSGQEKDLGLEISINDYPQYIKNVVKTKKTYYCRDIFTDELAVSERPLAKKENYNSRLVVPLISSGSVRGFMTCFMGENEELSEEDIKFIDSVASLIGLSIDLTNQNVEIDNIVKKFRNAIVSIENRVESLYENEGLDEYLKLICKDIVNITKSETSLIYLDSDEYDVRVLESYGSRKKFKNIIEFIDSQKERGKKIFNIEDLSDELKRDGIKTLAFERLVKDDKKIGKIILINADKYYMDDVRILSIYGTQAVLSVYIYINNRKIVENTLLHRDLELVEKQQKLIMEDEIFDEDDFISTDYINVPYRHVGGDFCKFKKVDEAKYILFVADVMGHGVVSNYFVAMMKGAINLLLMCTSSPADILSELNHILFKELDKMDVFITAKMIFFDFTTNRAYSANAGHTTPIAIYKDSGKGRIYKQLETNHSIALGIFENAKYKEDVIDITDIELFAVFTDGLIESKNPKGEEYGSDNLAKYLTKKLEQDNSKPCQGIMKELEEFKNSKKLEDDLTIFTLRKKDTLRV